MIKADLILYGTRKTEPGEFEYITEIEDVITATPANVLPAIIWAREKGYKNLRIVDYTNTPITMPDFVGALNIPKARKRLKA